jgi:hypothetical protein
MSPVSTWDHCFLNTPAAPELSSLAKCPSDRPKIAETPAIRNAGIQVYSCAMRFIPSLSQRGSYLRSPSPRSKSFEAQVDGLEVGGHPHFIVVNPYRALSKCRARSNAGFIASIGLRWYDQNHAEISI